MKSSSSVLISSFAKSTSPSFTTLTLQTPISLHEFTGLTAQHLEELDAFIKLLHEFTKLKLLSALALNRVTNQSDHFEDDKQRLYIIIKALNTRMLELIVLCSFLYQMRFDLKPLVNGLWAEASKLYSECMQHYLVLVKSQNKNTHTAWDLWYELSQWQVEVYRYFQFPDMPGSHQRFEKALMKTQDDLNILAKKAEKNADYPIATRILDEHKLFNETAQHLRLMHHINTMAEHTLYLRSANMIPQDAKTRIQEIELSIEYLRNYFEKNQIMTGVSKKTFMEVLEEYMIYQKSVYQPHIAKLTLADNAIEVNLRISNSM